MRPNENPRAGRPGRSMAFRAAMARSAERRKCPNCERKSALVTESDGWYRWRRCRWCDWHTTPHEIGT